MLLRQMPSTWPHHQRRYRIGELVRLAFRTGERDGAIDRIAHIDLPVQEIGPGRRVGVFEIGHENVRAAIESVDHNLAIHRARNLDPAVRQGRRNRGNRPVTGADLRSVRKEVRKVAGIDGGLPELALLEKVLPGGVEFLAQFLDELDRLRGQNFLPRARDRRSDFSHGLQFHTAIRSWAI